jgi:HEAT repeat protein
MASLAGRVSLALGLEPGERQSASLMLAHSFAMGLATVFFETTASALFLAHFGSGALPYVYIVAAALNTATGLVFTSIQARLSFATLMQGTLVFLLVSVVGLRAGLAATQAGWIFFALLVWYRAISTLTDLEYWAVATRLYDVGQAKRLYGLIGSGEVVARIAGSFSVPLLLSFTDVSNLIFLSAGAIAACLWLLMRTLPLTHDARAAPPRQSGSSLGAFARLLTNRYLQTLFGVVFFGILAKYFVDYAFLAQVKGRYTNAAELARFFGVFSGITQVLSLLARVALSGPLIARHGIRFGLLVLPTAHLLCTLLILTDSALFGHVGILFWLVIANQGLYKVLKHPIDNPSFKVLYQPLRSDQRLGAQIAVETMLTPITTGLAGAVMLLFTVVLPHTPTGFALVMLLSFAGWLIVARRAGRSYGDALVAALRGRLVHDGAISFADERSLAVLGETLKSDHPGDVRFALDLLENNAPERLGDVLAGLVAHPSADVRLAALARIERHRPASTRSAVEQRLATPDVPAVRAAAIRALAALGAGGDLLARWLDDVDPGTRAAAAAGLFKHAGAAADRARALATLAALAESRGAEERIAAVALAGELGAEAARPLLRAVLADERPAVRRVALSVAGALRDPELLPLVLPCLDHLPVASAAGRALVAMGAAALPHLEQAFETTRSALARSRIVRVLGRIRGARASAWLLAQLGFPDPDVRRELLEALRACGYHADEGDVPRIEVRLRDELRSCVEILSMQRDLSAAPDHEILAAAMARQAERAQERVFLLLSFVHDARAVLSARDNLRHSAKERRAYAREVLEVTLPHEVLSLAMPLLEELPAEERLARLAEAFPASARSAAGHLASLLGGEHFAVWPRALAIKLVRDTGAGELTALVARLSSSPEPLLHETARAYLEKTPMQTLERVLTLKSVEMFEQASEQVLVEVAQVLEEIEVKRGEVIFRRGELGDGMYVIVDGRVRVFDGDVTLGVLGERDIFGELALLDPEPRSASIAALQDTRLFRLDREAFAELMAGNIEIVRGVLHVLCERLRRQIAQDTAGQRR